MKPYLHSLTLFLILAGTVLVKAQNYPHPVANSKNIEQGSFLLAMVAMNNSQPTYSSNSNYFKPILQENSDVTSTSNTARGIELINFEVTPVSNNIRLDWSAEIILENTEFEVERSTNAEFFERIAAVSEPTTNNSKLTYSLKDNLVQPGQVYYYRLKYIDALGELQYSKIEKANIEGVSDLSISNFMPNPSRNSSIVRIVSQEPSTLTLALYAMDGKLVQEHQYEISEGVAELDVNMEGMAPGNYLAQFITNDKREVRKLIKVE